MRYFIMGCLITVFSFLARGAVDYTKCRHFIHPSSGTDFGPGSGMGMGMGMGFGIYNQMPFSLNDDGSIDKKDFADIKTEKNGQRQIITYSVPGMNLPSGVDVKPREFKMKVVLERDEKGNLQSMSYGTDLDKDALNEMRKLQIQAYENTVPKEIRESNDKILGKGASWEPPFVAYKENRVEFEVKNGKCVPMRSANVFLTEPKPDGDTDEVTTLDMALCKDVNDFIKANPEASACFRKDINERMSMIFKKHAPKYTSEHQSMMRAMANPYFGGGYGGFMGGMGANLGSMGFGSIAPNVIASVDEWMGMKPNDEQYMAMKKRFGNSPVINGQRLLQNCFDRGAYPIVEDESIWAEENRAQSGEANGESASEK